MKSQESTPSLDWTITSRRSSRANKKISVLNRCCTAIELADAANVSDGFPVAAVAWC